MPPSSLLPRRPPRRVVVTSLLACAALVLSACGTSTSKAAPSVEGVPAASISVPLSQVACTSSNFCVAAGTSNTGVGPLATAEFMTPSGHWHPVATPTSSTPRLSSSACEGTTCFLAGAQGRSDLLWRFDATSHQITAASVPPGGIGIRALTCYSLENCALIDIGANGVARFSFTADGAATWSTPLAMSWAASLSITSLQCAALFQCLATATSASHTLVQGTTDGGITWYPLGGASASWTSLQLAQCHFASCVGVATGATSRLVRTHDQGVTWTSFALGASPNALSCPSSRHCLVVGTTKKNNPWLASVTGTKVVSIRLRYVPTPLLGVACGTKRCAAIGVTTLVSFPVSIS
ncbi:MAG TPA: hypothetical protein VMU98_09575 [Acidimicrobiales bacterium]|nr:hypothetical protein [Acidimicrobiales bacterium]